jgi:hypothetical protein
MDAAAQYRLYATALYLNLLDMHDKNAEYCRVVMRHIAEQEKLSAEHIEQIYQEVVVEVDAAFDNLKQIKTHKKR